MVVSAGSKVNQLCVCVCVFVCVCVCVYPRARTQPCQTLRPHGLSGVSLHQAPLSMGFSRQQSWSGLPFPPPGDLSDPGIKPRSPALQADALTSEPPGKPRTLRDHQKLVGKYLSIPATKKCSGESFSSCFSCRTHNGTGWGGSGVGNQDRVGERTDGGGIGQEDHFLPHKFLKRTFQRRANSTKQLL